MLGEELLPLASFSALATCFTWVSGKTPKVFSNSLENAFDRLAFDFVLFRFFDGLFVSALVCKATVCRRRPNEIVGNQIRPVLYHCKPTQPFARWSYARRSSSDIKWSRSFLRSGGQKSIENLWISNVYRLQYFTKDSYYVIFEICLMASKSARMRGSAHLKAVTVAHQKSYVIYIMSII